MKTETLRVEVIHARPDGVWRRCVELPAGATAAQALDASGLLRQIPELNGARPATGVFGRICPPDHPLHDGDRMEVYRPLVYDPMESRRRRAHHRRRRAEETLSRT